MANVITDSLTFYRYILVKTDVVVSLAGLGIIHRETKTKGQIRITDFTPGIWKPSEVFLKTSHELIDRSLSSNTTLL